jgi:hypothetical protein
VTPGKLGADADGKAFEKAMRVLAKPKRGSSQF